MKYVIMMVSWAASLFAQCPPCSNQTSFFTPPLPEEMLPFRVEIEQADFSLVNGIQSFALATYKGEWLLIAGRTNGLHDVDNEDSSSNSFPVSMQNRAVYVVDPSTHAQYSRSLDDPSSFLIESQIDQLSVTNPIFYQTLDKKTLYVVGGYGINSATQEMETKSSVTAIDVPKLIEWVKNPGKISAKSCMRFANHPLLQLTGGQMCQLNPHAPYLLVFGQNFQGYYLQSSEGTYSKQVRTCQILDNGKDLFIQPYTQKAPIAEYHRRDLNVVPIIKKMGKSFVPSYVALAGGFTPGGELGTPGAWTAPIEIGADGSAQMIDPNLFSQALNNYSCPTVGFYSQKADRMFTVMFGGISAVIGIGAGDCSSECQAAIPTRGSNFILCCNLPFSNDVSTIEIDSKGNYFQYLMSARYPEIDAGLTNDPCTGDPLTESRQLWFGTSGFFVQNEELPMYSNGVIAFDKLEKTPLFLGYIVGGIASSLTDTNCLGDSTASRYIFKVTLSRSD